MLYRFCSNVSCRETTLQCCNGSMGASHSLWVAGVYYHIKPRLHSTSHASRVTRSVERCSVVHPRVQVHVEMIRLYFRARGAGFLL